MKQVININFQGRVVPIETTAFEILQNYTASLNRHFANEEGKEEIINDIESRIGELFQERLNKGATCITDDDVNAVINSIGRPEDFEPMEEGQPAAAESTSSASGQSTANNTSTGYRKLYRNENDKVLGGVCSGLASYFNIDVIVARIIFVVLLFSGVGFLTYIIMWIAVPSASSAQIGSTRKKLFRDPDEKMIAGVCSGIGHYFGINPWVPRALFLLPFLSFLSRWGHWGGFWDFGDIVRFTFSPTSLIVYVILWIVIPEAFSTSEKLEMKGEKVDMNSIKNSVMEEMKGVGKRASNFGKEASGMINEKAKVVAKDIQTFNRRNSGGIGNVIAMIAKIFAYFIIGCVCMAILGILIGLIVGAVKLYPLKDYLLDGNWQNVFAWGTLVFFIIIPFVGILIWLIRKVVKSDSNSRMLRLTFISLWIIGWACMVLFISSLDREFKRSSKLDEQEVQLSNPKVNKLVVTTIYPREIRNHRYRWNRFDSFEEFLDEDTLTIQNIKVGFLKSSDSSFHVSIQKEARGYSLDKANSNANKINFQVHQNDSLLILDDGIAINKYDKFRNQTVYVTIYVPVGKQVRVDGDYFRRLYFNNILSINDYDSYDDSYSGFRWQREVDYIMKNDGLYTLDGRKADGWHDKDANWDNNNKRKKGSYRFDKIEDSIRRKLDSIREKDEQRLDSIEKKHQQIKDSLDKKEEQLRDKIENGGNAAILNLGNEPAVGGVMIPVVEVIPNI
ncbi:MAG: PspC domain-containing protein [Bacteroidetes bacterium]|nr:PspC domain-containing protein [Bacteroidota bacterium]